MSEPAILWSVVLGRHAAFVRAHRRPPTASELADRLDVDLARARDLATAIRIPLSPDSVLELDAAITRIFDEAESTGVGVRATPAPVPRTGRTVVTTDASYLDARTDLTHDLGRAPTLAELAERLRVGYASCHARSKAIGLRFSRRTGRGGSVLVALVGFDEATGREIFA